MRINSALPNVQLFWTAYDPLDLASGSIDVLNFQRGYVALADKILPGFTTVTTSPRYVSMLCAAIGVAERLYPDTAESPIRLRQLRLTVIKSYERAWAIACGLAAAEDRIGARAIDGLRGIQSVRRRLSRLSEREKFLRTSSYNLLANQVRYGGIGTYSTFLEDCHLASMRSLSLRPLGMEVAAAFPGPPVDLAVHDEDRPLLINRLCSWGCQAHLGTLAKREAKAIEEALRGAQEGGREDDVRWTMLRLLAQSKGEELPEADRLKAVLAAIEGGQTTGIKSSVECFQQIQAALLVIRPLEQLYQTFQFLFERVLAAATDEVEAQLSEIAAQSSVSAASRAAVTAASRLQKSLEQAREIHAATCRDVEDVLTETGIVGLLTSIPAAQSATEMLSLVLNRHREVQQGKSDRGERKASWVRPVTADGKVSLTAQSYQLTASQRVKTWDQIPWHPYRTYGALRFIRQCNIR